MKNKKCPDRKFCFNYKGNDCEGCDVGDEILKLHKRIDRLKKQNETLTIQRNAWALTAKALAPEWISVDERLPEESACYLVNIVNHFGLDFVTFTHYTKCYGWGIPDVTHWMPLPEPPMMKGE